MNKQNLPESVEAVFPLSPTQQGMLYHSLHTPGSGMYLGQHYLALNNVNVDFLQQAWDLVVLRHASLRSVFAWRGLSKSVQLIYTSTTANIEPVDLPEADIPAWLAADASKDFDLTQSPPSRTFLITPSSATESNTTRSIFIWTRHHLLVDGWSAHLVLGDLQSAYAALMAGQAWQPGPAPRFASYIGWLQNSDSGASLAHWAKVLSDIEPQSELATIKTPVQGPTGSRRTERNLAPEITQTLNEARKAHGLTLSTLVHGAWAAVLAPLADEHQLVFGSTMAGRPTDLPDSQSIVGNFINTIPVVVDLTKPEQVTDWLQALQTQIVTGSLHGHITNRDMLAAAELPPATPLFSSVVVFMNYPHASTSSVGLQITETRYDEHSHYAVALLVEPGEHLKLILIHDLAEIDQPMADHLLDQAVARLTALPNSMKLPIVDFLSAAGRSPARLPVVALTEPVTDVVTAFENTTKKYPAHIALSSAHLSLSYLELAHVTRLLADRLHKLGVGAKSNVIIVMPRSIEGLVTIWATLSLSAAYVPLAIGSPVARIEDVARACDAQLVVTQLNITGLKTQSLCLTSIQELLPTRSDAISDANFEAEVPPVDLSSFRQPNSADIAYRIHTSGSTGQAKSIAVNHHQLGHSLAARLQYYGTTAYRFALLSPLAFDSSVASIYWTMASGGQLVLVPEDVMQNPTATADYLVQHQVDALLTLPTVYGALLAVAPKALLSALKLVIVAGETCPAALLQVHNDTTVDATLVNEYGPTEATVWCAAKKFHHRSELDHVTASLPIGAAIPGARLSVVNTNGEHCANGVIGELVVHGPIVAMPNLADGGYATGDLAQALPNGDLLFRGRKDHQIKIRGHRVEASEVEATIITHPAIAACAVVAQRAAPSTNINVLNSALNELSTAHALALLAEVEALGA